MTKFKAHDDLITDMQLFKDKYLLTCSWDFKVKLWDIVKGNCLRVYEGHSDKVTGICVLDFLPKSKEEVQREQARKKSEMEMRRQRGEPEPEEQQKDEFYFLTGGHDYLIKCWDLDKIDSKF